MDTNSLSEKYPLVLSQTSPQNPHMNKQPSKTGHCIAHLENICTALVFARFNFGVIKNRNSNAL